MNLKAKPYVENQKQAAQDQLAKRKSALEAKGLGPADTERDPTVKKLKADIRKANQRMTAIAAQEKLQSDKQTAKTEKAAAKKEGKAAGKSKAPKAAAGKEEKKEKKAKGKKKADK